MVISSHADDLNRDGETVHDNKLLKLLGGNLSEFKTKLQLF